MKSEWRKATVQKPEPYALVTMVDKKERTHVGWWCGGGWDGLKLPEDLDVVAWKKHSDMPRREDDRLAR